MSILAQQTFFWLAKSLDNKDNSGLVESSSKKDAKSQLKQKGYVRIELKEIPAALKNSALSTKELLSFLDSLLLLWKTGLPIIDVLTTIQKTQSSLSKKFICSRLLEGLHLGLSIKDAFNRMPKMFPSFFLSLIEISQQTGRSMDGFLAAYKYYQKKEQRTEELKKLLRYPSIVLTIAFLFLLSVLLFIIPMFDNIYSLFGDDLPISTKILVKTSIFLRSHLVIVCLVVLFGIIFFRNSLLKKVNPLFKLFRKLRDYFESIDDPFVFALSLKLQLESGQPLIDATANAISCLTDKNRRYGIKIKEKLEAGLSITKSFEENKWFPSIFTQLLSSAEPAGRLDVGFDQISIYLEKKRNDRFLLWSKFVEPLMMVIMGSVILVILLAIYLPIFELGNRVG